MEIKRGLKACRVILCFAIFYLCYDQITNNIISQAGRMDTLGISNDTIQSLNPIACVILGPIIQKLLFPFLEGRRISFGPIARMSVAFVFISFGMAYAAGTQHLIYTRAPCYKHPRACPAALTADGKLRPNNISVWVQIPVHFLLATGEILGLVSLSEYTYAEAPKDIKVVVQSFQQLTGAIGAALGVALGPVSKDPWLVIMFATFAGVTGIGALVFWVCFRRGERVRTRCSQEEPEKADRKDNAEACSLRRK